LTKVSWIFAMTPVPRNSRNGATLTRPVIVQYIRATSTIINDGVSDPRAKIKNGIAGAHTEAQRGRVHHISEIWIQKFKYRGRSAGNRRAIVC